MWYGAVRAEGGPAKGVVDIAYGPDGETLFTLTGNGAVSRQLGYPEARRAFAGRRIPGPQPGMAPVERCAI